jgi:hypothetical protein
MVDLWDAGAIGRPWLSDFYTELESFTRGAPGGYIFEQARAGTYQINSLSRNTLKVRLRRCWNMRLLVRVILGQRVVMFHILGTEALHPFYVLSAGAAGCGPWRGTRPGRRLGIPAAIVISLWQTSDSRDASGRH